MTIFNVNLEEIKQPADADLERLLEDKRFKEMHYLNHKR